MSLRYAHLADKMLHEASSFVGSAVTDAVAAARAKLKEAEEKNAELEAVA
ncbi:MAG: hypothetical protein IPJ12_07355 [Betaproteobacteria bacterium]|nr:hypothetical protein [Betaproteobacteria bacterium]